MRSGRPPPQRNLRESAPIPPSFALNAFPFDTSHEHARKQGRITRHRPTRLAHQAPPVQFAPPHASGPRPPHDEPAQADGLPPERRWLAVISLGVAVSMAVLDGSIANIALPTIASQMHATPAASIWVVNAYQLAVTISLLPLASLGDIHGHRRIFCYGLVLYTIASIVCAVATTLPELVLGRVLQGFGGAGIMSVNGALIRFIFPDPSSVEASVTTSLSSPPPPPPAPRSPPPSSPSPVGPGCSPSRCRSASSPC